MLFQINFITIETTNNEVKAIVKRTLTAADVAKRIEEGMIRDHYLQLEEGFDALYDLDDKSRTIDVTSWKTNRKIKMQIWNLVNAHGSRTVWESTMMGALVIEEDIKVDKVRAAGELPVFFREDFMEKYSNTKLLSDYRNADGGVDVYDKYEVVGALISKSPVDATRWSVSYKFYEKGHLFLAYEQQDNADVKYVKEERLLEISSGNKEDRTFKHKDVMVTLPSKSELKIKFGADKNVKFAKAQFILKKIWE